MKQFVFFLFFLFILASLGFGQDKENLREGFRLLSKNKPKVALSYFYDVFKNGDSILSPYALYGMAKSYFDMNDYDYAAYEFEQFVKNYKDNILFENASHYLSKSFLKVGRYPYDVEKTKNTTLLDDEKELKSYKKRDERVYDKARAYGRRKKYEKAIKLLNNLIAEYPRSEYVDNALYYLGTYYEALDNIDSALYSFLWIIYKHPKSYYIDGAIFKAGTIYYAKGEYQNAYNVYSQAKINQVGDESPMCLLLWGTTAEKLGQKESAAGIYNFIAEKFDHTYHSYRAKERLFSLGYAVPQYKNIRGEEVKTFADIFLSQGKPIIPIQYVEKKVKKAVLYDKANDIPIEGWMINYPRSFWDNVFLYSNENGIDPYLTLAVIREESRFEPQALSRSKAHGLMQIIPSTGKILAQKLEITPFRKSKMYESQTNIKMGTYYLANLIKRFNGNVFLAVAGYNGGPVRVKKWVDEWFDGDLSKVDIDEFVQRIPIRETRNYVQKVMGSYYEYKRLYDGKQ